MENIEIAKIATALNKAQSMMKGAKKDKANPFYKSRFADLSSVFDAIREPFAVNGLSVTQTMDVLESGRMVLKTCLMHISGEYIDSKMILPDIQDPQKIGSAITYFKRYSLMAIAGLPSEDDDGNQATKATKSPVKYINSKQIENIEALINGHADVRKQVLDNCSQDFSTITTDRYPGALEWITKLVKNKG